jgi:hypothetical protein
MLNFLLISYHLSYSDQAYGWGVLILAGAGSYIWAKQHIDERRRQQEKSGARPREVKTCEFAIFS